MSARRAKSSQAQQTGLPKIGDGRLVELGEALRSEYADIENEPLPDRLKAMVDALKETERKTRGEP
ncbi:MAG: NepR family anti-sigma factor [Hyphomonas sp.]|nr:NepR family anti-sigma factor [Hyphomonas sp.]